MKITETHKPGIDSCTVVSEDASLVTLHWSALTKLTSGAEDTALALVYVDLIMSGTKKHTRADLHQILDTLGANVNFNSHDGNLTLNLTCLSHNLNKVLHVVKSVLLEPSFKDSELKRAKLSLTSALQLELDNAKQLALANLRNHLFGKNALLSVPEVEEVSNSLKSITTKQVKNLHQRFLDSYYLVSAGANVTALKQIGKFVDNTRTSYKCKQDIRPRYDVALQPSKTQKRLLTEEIHSKQNIEISIGDHLPLTVDHPDYPAFVFGMAVLCKVGGFSGRLMSTVREKEGLTYMIYGRPEEVTREHEGHWRIFTYFSPTDAKQGIASTLREIKQIADQGITNDEWRRFQMILETSETLLNDSLDRFVGVAHSQLLIGLSLEEYRTLRKKIYASKRSDINLVLKQYLNPKSLVVSMAGPINKADMKVIRSWF